MVSHTRHPMHPLLALRPPSCWLPERSAQPAVLPDMRGYFLFASNTAKRCIEVLRRLSISVLYETIISALRRNGEASLKQLSEEIRHRRFFVSFDNMNFFRNVRDQRVHNHAHQVNYTAGFVCVLECCAKRQCECGSLPA